MATNVKPERRVKISATIDANLYSALSTFVQEHSDTTSLSRELDTALQLWQKEHLREAMRAQYQREQSPQEQQERRELRQLQRQAAQRLLRSNTPDLQTAGAEE